VFHIEAFVVPHRRKVSIREMTDLQAQVTELDWKIQDVVIVPVERLPQEADPGRHETPPTLSASPAERP
jgi:hypothetical protein